MKRFAFCVLLLLTILISAPSISAQECDETGSNPAVEAILNRPDLAEKNPDEFSWKVLIAISAPCYRKCPANGSQNVGSSRIALWDTWADDLYTFPSQPDPWDQDPSKINKPDWNSRLCPSARTFVEDPLRKLFRKEGSSESPPKDPEFVLRNKAAFSYIVDNCLWYREGLNRGCALPSQTPNPVTVIDFPSKSIEIKARWSRIDGKPTGKYYWRYFGETPYMLVGIHVITKTIKFWTWATWEYVDNFDRCYKTGCFDSFGVTPDEVVPSTQPHVQYPGDRLTPALLKLFKEQNLGPGWRNYRLKGSQVNFAFRPMLGNSQMETNIPDSASCISCHRKASFDKDGCFPRYLGLNGSLGKGPIGLVNVPDGYTAADFVWAFVNTNPVNPQNSCLYGVE